MKLIVTMFIAMIAILLFLPPYGQWQSLEKKPLFVLGESVIVPAEGVVEARRCYGDGSECRYLILIKEKKLLVDMGESDIRKVKD